MHKAWRTGYAAWHAITVKRRTSRTESEYETVVAVFAFSAEREREEGTSGNYACAGGDEGEGKKACETLLRRDQRGMVDIGFTYNASGVITGDPPRVCAHMLLLAEDQVLFVISVLNSIGSGEQITFCLPGRAGTKIASF